MKVVSLVSNPQPGGPDSCIYVPQLEGGPVIPLGTGFHFRLLLRLAGLRWRYSTPPPHEESFCFYLGLFVVYLTTPVAAMVRTSHLMDLSEVLPLSRTYTVTTVD
jgi:hypothetical protein